MLYKYYKNGNIHIKYDSDVDGYTDEKTYSAMVCIIANSMLDIYDVQYIDSYMITIPIINHANNNTYDYIISYYDVEHFFAGKWIILYGHDKHAFIKIPPFFQSDQTIEYNNIKYRIYKLEKMPTIDFMKKQNSYGVLFKIVSPQYAPEIKHCAMFVPFGAAVEYLTSNEAAECGAYV